MSPSCNEASGFDPKGLPRFLRGGTRSRLFKVLDEREAARSPCEFRKDNPFAVRGQRDTGEWGGIVLQRIHGLSLAGFGINPLDRELAALVRERVNVASTQCPIVQIPGRGTVEYLTFRPSAGRFPPDAR